MSCQLSSEAVECSNMRGLIYGMNEGHTFWFLFLATIEFPAVTVVVEHLEPKYLKQEVGLYNLGFQ